MDILKKICIIVLNFPKNVNNDLYKLCFQNYCTLLLVLKNQFKLHRSLLGMKGRGQNSPLNSPFSNIIAVKVKINIFKPNFS